MKAACFSVAAMDYFPLIGSYHAGGNALNQSIRLTNLGAECTFIGALGTDEFGDKLYDLMRRAGVNVSLIERIDGSTASNRLINDASGERFGEDGAWNGGVFESYRITDEKWEAIRDYDIWSTHASCPDFQEAIRRKGNSKLCVDYLHLPDFRVLQETIDLVDIAYIGGSPDMIENLSDLSNKTDTLIVLTMGSEGSLCLDKGKIYSQSALSCKVVDTTGCGDAFQAGFTYSYFSTGSIESALRAGAENGKLATAHFGGVRW